MTTVVGDMEGAVVKKNHGCHSATTLTPAAGLELIRNKTKAAIERIEDFEPYELNGPPVIWVSLKHYQPVELLAYLKDVKRVDSHTIEFAAADMTEASKFMAFVLEHNVATSQRLKAPIFGLKTHI